MNKFSVRRVAGISLVSFSLALGGCATAQYNESNHNTWLSTADSTGGEILEHVSTNKGIKQLIDREGKPLSVRIGSYIESQATMKKELRVELYYQDKIYKFDRASDESPRVEDVSDLIDKTADLRVRFNDKENLSSYPLPVQIALKVKVESLEKANLENKKKKLAEAEHQKKREAQEQAAYEKEKKAQDQERMAEAKKRDEEKAKKYSDFNSFRETKETDFVASVLNYSSGCPDGGCDNSFWYAADDQRCVYSRAIIDYNVYGQFVFDRNAESIDLNSMDPQNIEFKNHISNSLQGYRQGVITSYLGKQLAYGDDLNVDRLARGWGQIYSEYCSGKKDLF